MEGQAHKVLRHEGARGNSKTDRLYSNVTSLELNFAQAQELATQKKKCSKKPWELLVNCRGRRRWPEEEAEPQGQSTTAQAAWTSNGLR